MNPWPAVVATALLWATAAGIGLLLTRPTRGAAVSRGLALSAIAGLCAMAAALPSLFLLGLPRPVVLGLAYAVAAAGWLQSGAAALRAVDRQTLVTLLVTLLAIAGPATIALSTPTTAYDALMTWWPKVAEVGNGDLPYIGAATDTHVNPAYPRGLAWLSSVANPLGPPSQQVMHMVTWSWVWLTALVLVAVARNWLRTTAALSVAVMFLLLPDVAYQAACGLADSPIGAAALVAALGLTDRPRGRGYALCAVAGVGAAAIKTEGMVVLLVVVAHLVFDVLRHAERRRQALLALSTGAVLLPVLLSSSGEPQTRMEVLPWLMSNPDVALIRMVAAIEGVLHFQVAPASFPDAGVYIGNASGWTGWLFVASLVALLLCGGRRVLAVSPALMLLPAAVAVYSTTGISVHWHIATTLPRLMVEMVPTCLLAAVVAVFGRRQPGPAGVPASSDGRWVGPMPPA